MAGKFTTTTKDVGLLRQLHNAGQLTITPEFQRNAVWSRPARAYLIDTILTGSPIPVLYFQRSVSAQTNRVEYAVVDGQQRLNSVFLFMDNRFSLTESDQSAPWYRHRWKDLSDQDRESILSYDFVVQELSGFSSDRIRDMFRRMNRYVVALNPQELRHSEETGAFKSLAEEVGAWPVWTTLGIITPQASRRMKSDELAAELLILVNEGPQDKKESVDLYYRSFRDSFDEGDRLRADLERYVTAISRSYPELRTSPLRRAASAYSLIGALSEIEAERGDLPEDDRIAAGLSQFSAELTMPEEQQTPRAARYLVAQSRQTDNLRPRRTRIEILKQVLLGED